MRATMKATAVAVATVVVLGAGILLDANAQDGAIARLMEKRDCSGCNLAGANLSGANLEGVVLYKADLSDADLSNANLSGANLTGANLRGANLSNANLNLANLTGANAMDNLSQALTNATTTCPDGTGGPCR